MSLSFSTIIHLVLAFQYENVETIVYYCSIDFLGKMSLIAGVGDEVIQFLTVIFVVIVATIAWWSTNARPDRYRTVLLMRSRNQHPITVNLLTSESVDKKYFQTLFVF